MRIPKDKYISKEIDPHSIKILDEYHGLLSRMTISDVNDSLIQLIAEAKKPAEASDIFQKAEHSMEDRMRIFVAQFYDLRKYNLQFHFVPSFDRAIQPQSASFRKAPTTARPVLDSFSPTPAIRPVHTSASFFKRQEILARLASFPLFQKKSMFPLDFFHTLRYNTFCCTA